MDTFKDWVIVIGIVMLVIALSVALAIPLYVGMELPSCNARTADMQIAHRWSFFGGCQVEVEPDLWIPLTNYRYVK